MWRLLTFAAGIVVGAVGVKALKKAEAPAKLTNLAHKARGGLDKAGEGLRDATVSGLSAVEKSSAGLRAKLSGEAGPSADEAPADETADGTATSRGTSKNEEA
ncbi:hypothetical protein CCR94_21365 [Rhodoblastus sphagnicola]|uniref:Uncharacterized protein n=1 Tax=Rhodoblastus sphagnicola TaxID=333368 RepID=A0A2S6MX78_9HYPH|nr:hypothetical protein [Rhodoblastus sphagnicola]MBB4199308.1 hypothetical protein [Rhodoblastus sphagnicola]PPQ26973.1 hypothetical protein CCR94_21365 [Rhodoblastus sphagnicola]